MGGVAGKPATGSSGPARRAGWLPGAPRVRVHLSLLALLALLPAWMAAGLVAVRAAEAERTRLVQAAQTTARDIAVAVEREVAGLRASLLALATTPDLPLGDPGAFAPQAALLRAAIGVGVALSEAPSPVSGGARGPVASPLVRDPEGGQLVVRFEIAVPPDGTLPARGRLTLTTDAETFWSPILERAHLPEGWVASVLDGHHLILARAPEAGRFLGQPVHPDALAALRAGGDAGTGWHAGLTRDGRPVHIAWHRVGGLPWTVLVGVPRDSVDGAVERALAPVLLAGLSALLGVTIGVASWGRRRLAQPLHALELAAAAVGRGEVPLAPRPCGVREIDAVAEALVATATTRREHAAEREAMAARLAMVLESTTDGVVVVDLAGRLTYHNERAERLLAEAAQAPPGKLLGLRLLDLFQEAARDDLAAALAEARRTGLPGAATIASGPAGPFHATDVFPTPEGLTVFFRDVTAARQAEQALRESEARLQAVLDHVPVGVLLADAATGRILLSNRRLAELLGERSVRSDRVVDYGRTPATDAEGREVLPADRPLARALRGQEEAGGEYQFHRRDGRRTWLRVRAVPIRDQAGRVVRAVAALMDIDAERRAAEALRQTELRFRTLAEAVPQIVWSSGPDGTLDYVNQRFFEFTGQAPEMAPARIRFPIHPEDQRESQARWEAALARGEPYEAEYRLRRADGVWRWMVARAVPARGGGTAVERWVGAVTDMTELIETRRMLERQVAAEDAARAAAERAAEALAASETRFRRFAEASPDALWLLDAAADRLDYVSPAFERFWGTPPDPAAGHRALATGVRPEDRPEVEAALARLRTGEPTDIEYRIERVGDGTPAGGGAPTRWVRVLSFAVGEVPAPPRANGHPPQRLVGGFVRDVTLRREAEERQRLLIGELNHRVKNTLAIVLSLAHQTARRARSDDAGPEGFVRDFQGRLMALARAHDLLTASTWRGALLGEVAASALLPWRGPPGAEPAAAQAGAPRFLLAGPAVWLAARQALGLALAFHEMATNAAKHGALVGTAPAGQVSIAWERDPSDPAFLALDWIESGGPAASCPTREGFGTRLLRGGLPIELGPDATVALDYTPAGFRARIRFRPAAGGGTG